MKITITPAEAQAFATHAAPLLTFVDLDTNKNRKAGDGSPRSNMTLDMYEDIEKGFNLGHEVKDTGPTFISNVDGNLVIEIKPELVMEFTSLYLKSTLELVKPLMTLIPMFKKQSDDMKSLMEKWSPKKD